MSDLIITRTYSGGKDLYNGMPNLDGALVTEIINNKTTDDYETILVLTKKDGSKFKLYVQQEIE